MGADQHLRASPDCMEWAFLALCAAILTWQLFLPGFIGIADNGDFPKVAGRLCLAAADHDADKFDYFQPDYLRAAASCYNPHIPESEFVPVWLAAKAERAIGPKRHFDIRWLGALHALLFVGLYYLILLMLRPLHPAARGILSLAALWIFADVSVIAYLNSFYSDVPAILGGLAAIVAAELLAGSEHTGWGWLALFGVAALFFTTSKTQHTVSAPLAIAAAAWFGWRSRDTRTRSTAAVVCAALIVGMICMFNGTPAWYSGSSRYNLIFLKIAAASRNPAQDVAELGVDPGNVRYASTNAYMPKSPTRYPFWYGRFYTQTSSARICKFYLRHPAVALAFLRSDLSADAKVRRVLGNFPRAYGRPPGAMSDRLATWRSLRTCLFRLWPGHVVVWYALGFLGAPLLALWEKSRFKRALLVAIAVATVAGALEFGVAALGDAAETSRHLWMFHVFTDATVFLALVFIGARWTEKRAAS